MPENQQKLSENLEDYLETISSLSAGTGAARPSDIAAAMSVKRPSVTAALNSLREKGLVEYEKYKPVTLTKDGEAVAMNVRRKHRLLSDFFTGVLGVNASEAISPHANGACARRFNNEKARKIPQRPRNRHVLSLPKPLTDLRGNLPARDAA